MKTKCPVCNSCLDYSWVANRRFFSCFLCRVTYDIFDNSLRRVKEIITEQNINGNDVVKKVVYYDSE